MATERYRLVTRSDFDGLVCAVLLKQLDLVGDIAFVHPKDVQDGVVAQLLAAGKPIVGVTWDVVADINAKHAREFDGVTVEAAIDLLQRNSGAAAGKVRTWAPAS